MGGAEGLLDNGLIIMVEALIWGFGQNRLCENTVQLTEIGKQTTGVQALLITKTLQ